MTPAQLEAYLARTKARKVRTYKQTADALGIHSSSLANYRRGHTSAKEHREAEPPKWLPLALVALELGFTDWDGETDPHLILADLYLNS